MTKYFDLTSIINILIKRAQILHESSQAKIVFIFHDKTDRQWTYRWSIHRESWWDRRQVDHLSFVSMLHISVDQRERHALMKTD